MDRILIIEDEKQMAQMLSDYLKANDFDTDIAYDGFSAVRHISEEDYNLILMDVMIPDMDGFDVLKILRRNKTTPVIFLTARSEEADKIAALEQGADDYIVKPFSFRELVARIRAVLRRMGPRTNKMLICGDFNVAPSENDVWNHKQLLKIVSHTPIEVERLTRLFKSLDFTDAVRKFYYSWK